MPQVNITGWPAIAWSLGYVILAASPIWLAAKLTGARHASLLRAILALFGSTLINTGLVYILGHHAWWLSIIAYLLAFRFILGSSFLGGVFLGLLAMLGYALLGHYLLTHPGHFYLSSL